MHTYIENLVKTLNTQDNCGCSTPLFAVYTGPDEKPELERLFITEASAEEYIDGLRHRLRNARIEVLGRVGNDLKNLIMFMRGVSPVTEEPVADMSEWKPKNYYG